MFGRRYGYTERVPQAYDAEQVVVVDDGGPGAFVARAVLAVGSVVAGLIVIAILLVVLGANPHNGLVSTFTDIGSWLAGPFKGLFTIHDPDWRVIVNWGLAAVVYAVVARLIASVALR